MTAGRRGSTGRPSRRSSTSSAAPSPARCSTADGCRDLARDVRRRRPVPRRRSTWPATASAQGEYRYFAHPLPAVVDELRAAFWPHLLPIARTWAERAGRPAPWPDAFDDWLAMCHDAGQRRPTPLLLRYGPGDWNALHRDLYGDLVFPLQVVVGLDRPGATTTAASSSSSSSGRAPSRGRRRTLIGQRRGARVHDPRPAGALGARAGPTAPMRHGVSVVRRGRRRTLGLVFHDAA